MQAMHQASETVRQGDIAVTDPEKGIAIAYLPQKPKIPVQIAYINKFSAIFPLPRPIRYLINDKSHRHTTVETYRSIGKVQVVSDATHHT
jgi:hypothetical protein